MAARRFGDFIPSLFSKKIAPPRADTCKDCPPKDYSTYDSKKPAALVNTPSCVAPVGGKVYCRAAIDGQASDPLPEPFDAGRVCSDRGCANLRFAHARVCSRDGTATAWAEVYGLSELWEPVPHERVPATSPR